MIFKIIYNNRNRRIRSFLQRLHLYHPSLKQLAKLSEGREETLLERSRQFSSLLHGLWINGVDKRTGLGRLAELDRWLTGFITVDEKSPVSILDVGGSDGSTTYDLVHLLQQDLGGKFSATILERQMRLHAYRRGLLRYYMTYDHRPFILQFGAFAIILEEGKGKLKSVFNPIVKRLVNNLKKNRFENRLQDEGDLLIINPIVRQNPNIDWIEQDLFEFNENLVEKFSIVRCCNILNINYFKQEQLSMALSLLSSYLKADGLLLVSRSLDHTHIPTISASIWKKTPSGLQHLADLNGGSEIKSIVARQPEFLSQETGK